MQHQNRMFSMIIIKKRDDTGSRNPSLCKTKSFIVHSRGHVSVLMAWCHKEPMHQGRRKCSSMAGIFWLTVIRMVKMCQRDQFTCQYSSGLCPISLRDKDKISKRVVNRFFWVSLGQLYSKVLPRHRISRTH